jgi:hypothetical protein
VIAFDTTALSLVWVGGSIPTSRLTLKPVKFAKERVEALIKEIAAKQDVILIPAPVLSEVIVRIPAKADELIQHLRTSPWFRVGDFNSAAAVDLALRTAKALAAGDKREGLKDPPWTKIKFDRQIVSIAIVNQASEIISDDGDVAAIGERWNFRVRRVEDLPVPPELVPPPLLAGLQDEEDS